MALPRVRRSRAASAKNTSKRNDNFKVQQPLAVCLGTFGARALNKYYLIYLSY